VNQRLDDKVYRLADDFSLFKGDFKEKRFQLFNIANGAIYKLNEVAYDMLSLFDGGKNVKGVFNELKNLYDVEDEKLKEDLDRLLNQWVEKKVLLETE
jgi:hypothetical protein